MLIAQKLNKIDKALNTLTQDTHTELYEQINKDLLQIKENLNKDIKHAETHLENKLLNENKEFQDLTTTWLQNQVNELKPEIKTALDLKADKVLNELSQSITQSINAQIQQKITEKTNNLHTQIDLNIIIKNIKSDQSIIQEIKNNASTQIKQDLNTIINRDFAELKENAKNALVSKLQSQVDLNTCIKLALNTQTLNQELQEQIHNKVTQLVNNYIQSQDLQNDINRDIENIKQGFLSFINTQKQNTIDLTNEKIRDINEYLLGIKEEVKRNISTHKSELERETEALKKASQIVINEFDAYLREQKEQVLENIINNITNDLNNAEFQSEIFQAIKEAGLTEIMQNEASIKNEIINEVIKQITESLTKDELYNAILNNETILNRLESLSTDLLNEKLTHAVVKDYVAESLKEKAKEILKSDELLRAEAEAQAHLNVMQLQSKLASMQDVLNALKEEQDLTQQLQELANKKQELAQALQEAKDELKQELAQSVMSDKMQKLITDTLTNEINTLKQQINQETQDTINALLQTQEALIQANRTQIQELAQKITELENKANSGGNANGFTDNVDNKILAFT